MLNNKNLKTMRTIGSVHSCEFIVHSFYKTILTKYQLVMCSSILNFE